jgi:hypothetical protein
MSGPRPHAYTATTAPRSPTLGPSRASVGERRLRALSRLAIPERPVPLARAVEPGAGTSAPVAASDQAQGV